MKKIIIFLMASIISTLHAVEENLVMTITLTHNIKNKTELIQSSCTKTIINPEENTMYSINNINTNIVYCYHIKNIQNTDKQEMFIEGSLYQADPLELRNSISCITGIEKAAMITLRNTTSHEISEEIIIECYITKNNP